MIAVMKRDLLIELLKLTAAGFAGALFSSFFGAFFSFRRFRKEETWKQRRDTYHEILLGIEKIRENAAAISDYYATQGHMGQENWNRLGETLDSLQNISRADDFIISPVAAKALKAFIGVFDHPEFGCVPPDDAEDVVKSGAKAVPIIKAEAARHLGLEFSKTS